MRFWAFNVLSEGFSKQDTSRNQKVREDFRLKMVALRESRDT